MPTNDNEQLAGDTDRYPIDGIETCEECGREIVVGVIDGDFGLFCECTALEGRPFKTIKNSYPWPERWETHRGGDHAE